MRPIFSGIQPLGPGSGIMDFEDFLVSSNLLPLGSLVYLAFCVSRNGWGWENFLEEADTGKGLRFPRGLRWYMTWVLPAVVVVIYVKGYWDMFAGKGTGIFMGWSVMAVTFLSFVGWIVFGRKKGETGQL